MCFNEAGAILPRIHSGEVGACLTMSCFNEAGARLPPDARATLGVSWAADRALQRGRGNSAPDFTPFATMATLQFLCFNEAGARLPRIPESVLVQCVWAVTLQ